MSIESVPNSERPEELHDIKDLNNRAVWRQEYFNDGHIVGTFFYVEKLKGEPDGDGYGVTVDRNTPNERQIPCWKKIVERQI